MSYERTHTVTFAEHRCWDCGRWYACETFSANHNCPHCAHKRIEALVEQVATLERSRASLRGAVTRRGRRR